MRKDPWHSVKQDIHHICTNCTTGHVIPGPDRRDGTGGKPLCGECAKLVKFAIC